VGTKERYHENRTRVFEIQGIDPKNRNYNCHHIIERSDYKTRQQKKFWDDSVPSGRFDIDGKGNIFPLPVEEHANLHRKLEGLSPVTIRKWPEIERKKTKKGRRKARKKKRKSRSKRYRGHRHR